MENHIDVASGGRIEGSIEKLSAAQPAEPAVSLIEVQIPSALFRKKREALRPAGRRAFLLETPRFLHLPAEFKSPPLFAEHVCPGCRNPLQRQIFPQFKNGVAIIDHFVLSR